MQSKVQSQLLVPLKISCGDDPPSRARTFFCSDVHFVNITCLLGSPPCAKHISIDHISLHGCGHRFQHAAWWHISAAMPTTCCRSSAARHARPGHMPSREAVCVPVKRATAGLCSRRNIQRQLQTATCCCTKTSARDCAAACTAGKPEQARTALHQRQRARGWADSAAQPSKLLRKCLGSAGQT